MPWSDVIGQRNIVIHEYHHLDLDAIWAVATEDVPALQEQLGTIRQADRDETEAGES